MEHKLQEPVAAIPCWGIYADYDANAPDTQSFYRVATEELAKEVCDFLNEDPRRWNMAFVDGFESCKSWAYRGTLERVKDAGTIVLSLDSFKERMKEDERWDEEDESED